LAVVVNADCLGVKSRAQGGEYLLLWNDIDAGDPAREPWCREDDDVGLGEKESSEVLSGGLAIITLPLLLDRFSGWSCNPSFIVGLLVRSSSPLYLVSTLKSSVLASISC